jgi:endoglucanase
MATTTCYAPDGTVRTIHYHAGPDDSRRPDGDAIGFIGVAAHPTSRFIYQSDEFDEEILEEPNGKPWQGRRAFLGRTGRTGLAIATASASLWAVQGLANSGFATDLVGNDLGRSATRIPEQVSPAPRMIAVNDRDRREWAAFRARFISPDGRVVDTGNHGVSHTEGQGWGLLVAVTGDDPACTGANLRRPDDALHAWRYVPSQARPVDDLNNATDGDLFIAWALWRAAYRWGRADYALASRAIARDVLRLLVRQAGERTVLLPAAFGFEHGANIDLNPSYYCFPALRELAEAMPSPVWSKLHDHGLAMISQGRFGRWQLPPDWLSVARRDGSLSPAAGWPARFSYDAIRVPLNLSWSRLLQPEVHESFVRYWHETSPLPAWVDLRTGNLASYPAPAGIAAVAKIATSSAKTALPADFPSIGASTDYYSAALILLSRLAWQENLGV